MATNTRNGFSHTQTVLYQAILAKLNGTEMPETETPITDAELNEFINSRIEQVAKKNSAERKPTTKQIQNDAFAQDIAEWMEQGKTYSISDIHKGVPSILASGISPSRVVACLTKLKASGTVKQETVKGKSYYTLA